MRISTAQIALNDSGGDVSVLVGGQMDDAALEDVFNAFGPLSFSWQEISDLVGSQLLDMVGHGAMCSNMSVGLWNRLP